MTNPKKPQPMGNRVWLIDLWEQGTPYRTGAYLILDDAPTLIDTGSTVSLPHLLTGLKALSLSPEDLKYVVVTHVHLDHAGAAGHLMALAKNAQLVVHPRGARHLMDPTRLWQGAAAVYGNAIEQLFGSMEPVPADRVLICDHLDTLDIGQRRLTFFDSPGHAKHHFTILDPRADALYAGDALGIRYRRELTGCDFEWIMPSTSPVDFDPEALERTIVFLETVPFSTVFHAHYGPSEKAVACRETLRYGQAMAKWIAEADGPEQDPRALADALAAWTEDQLRAAGHTISSPLRGLSTDMLLNAMGLQVYWKRRLNPS